MAEEVDSTLEHFTLMWFRVVITFTLHITIEDLPKAYLWNNYLFMNYTR